MLTKSTVSFNDFLDLIGNFEVVIENDGLISYNGFKSWYEYNDKVNLFIKKVEAEILDNLLYLEEGSKIAAYLRWLSHRLDQNLLSIDYIELAIAVQPYQENIKANPMLVDYVSDILVGERGTLNVPNDMKFLPENFTSSMADFLTVASSAALNIVQFISEEQADNEHENIDISSRTIKSNLKQQLLIIYLLDQHKIFRFREIHDDMTQQADFLSYLLNGGQNLYKWRKLLGTVKHEETFLTKLNVIIAKEAFKHTKFESIKAEIDSILSNIDKN